MDYKNTRIYNNGVKNIRLQPDTEPPEGFVRGQVRRPYTEEERLTMKEKRHKTCMEKYGNPNYKNTEKGVKTRNNGNTPYVKGKHFYNNGETNKLFFPDEVPEGWVMGRTDAFDNQYIVENYARCENKESKKERLKEFEKILEESDWKYEKDFLIGNKRYDFKINDTLIELDNGVKINPSDNYEYSTTAKFYGYRCISIFDWDDIYKIINLLTPRKTLYARNTQVKVIDDKEIVKEFLNAYHLQNYIKYDVAIGLYDKEELVSVMTFGKPRYNKKYEWELLRYCSKYDITGGGEKLFKYFEETYNPKSVISYCDLSKFNGKIYDKLGFNLKNTSYSKHWYRPSTNTHVTDNLLRQRGFDQLFDANYGKGTSNEELMREHGFVEIYDCGQSTYIKEYSV